MPALSETFEAIIASAVDRAAARVIHDAANGCVIKPKQYITTAEAAFRLDHSPETLAEWRSEKRGPPWTGKGRLLRYNVDALDKWLASQPTADKAV